MKAYRQGYDVTAEIFYLDEDGQQVFPDSASYRVVDGDGVELVASTPLVIEADDVLCNITVDAATNSISGPDSAEMRLIELSLVTSEGVVFIDHRYIIESDDGLILYENTFMTFNVAMMTAFYMSKTDQFDLATTLEKTNALKGAFLAMGKIRYTIRDADFSKTNFYLGDLTSDEWLALPQNFYENAQQAQIAQAEFELGGDWIDDKRRKGLMSETIGESSNMFRTGKPIVMPVCSRAMSILSGYVAIGKNIGRA